jgi:cytochrome c peroxidase
MHVFRKQKLRTPSLVGVALSAPYYHDGSVSTLGELIRSHEKNNPMAVGDELSAEDLEDLERFLASL